DKTNGANLLTIAVGHSFDLLTYVLGEFTDLSAVANLRRPLITIGETGERIVKTAADQSAVNGSLTSGATARVPPRGPVGRGSGRTREGVASARSQVAGPVVTRCRRSTPAPIPRSGDG